MAAALTATLRADITQFEKSLDQAETKVAGLQRSTAQTNRELAKFGNDFGGANLIRQANTMVKAVEDIGGVTRLTTTEQKRLASSVDEALTKYRALGQEVPPSLVKISSELGTIRKAEEEATRAANELAAAQKKATGELAAGVDKAKGSFGGFDFGLKSIATGIAGAFTVGAVVNFGKEIVALGGEITDLAARTGLSVEGVQEFKYAAEQTGSSIDAFAGAATKLQDKLVSGDKGLVGAFKDLGLSTSELRNASPEELFTRVADAIGRVPDPMKQTQLALDLFGKSGAEILPAIKAGFSDLREEARLTGQVLSKEDVAALDDFGDAFDRTLNRLKVTAATAAVAISDSLTSGWERFLANVDAGIKRGGGLAGFTAGFTDGALTRPGTDRQRTSDIGLDVPKGEGTVNFTAQLKAAREELGKLTAAERDQIKAAKDLDVSNKDIADSLNSQNKSLNLTAQAIGIYIDGVKQGASALKEGFTANLQKAADEAARAARDIEKLGGVTKLDAQQREVANKVLYEGVRAYKALGEEASPAARKVSELAAATFTLPRQFKAAGDEGEQFLATLKKLTPALKAPDLAPWARLKDVFPPTGYPGLAALLKQLQQTPLAAEQAGGGIKEFGDELKAVEDDLKRAAREAERARQEMEQLGASIGDSIGRAVTDLLSGGSLGDALAQLGSDIGSQIGDQLGKSMSKSMGGGFGGGLTGTLVSAGFSFLVDKLVEELNRGAVRAAQQLSAETARLQIQSQYGGNTREMRRQFGRADVPTVTTNILTSTDDRVLSPEQIAKQWGIAQTALNQYQTELDGLSTVMQGVLKVTTSLTGSLDASAEAQSKPFLDAQKAEIEALKKKGATSEEIEKKQAQFAEENEGRVYKATESQIAQYNRLGLVAGAAIVNVAGRTGDMVAAVMDAAPALDQLLKARDEFGLADQTSAATEQVLNLYKTVSDNADVFSAVTGWGQILTGFGDALITNIDLVNAAGQDLEQQALTLEARGVSVEEIYRLLSPQLQTLWETVQDGKLAVDDTTAALLAQAEAQGVVGDNMRDVNQQILMVLEEIRDMFSDQLPEAIGRTSEAAERSGTAQRRALSDTRAATQDAIDAAGELPDVWDETTQAIRRAADEARRSGSNTERSLDDQADQIGSTTEKWGDYRDKGTVAQQDIRDEIRKTSDALKDDFPEAIKIRVIFDVDDLPPVPGGYTGTGAGASGGVGSSTGSSASTPSGSAGQGFWDPTGQVIRGPNGEEITIGPGSGRPGTNTATASLDVPQLAAPSVSVDLAGVTFVGNMEGQPVLRYVAKNLPKWVETRTGQKAA